MTWRKFSLPLISICDCRNMLGNSSVRWTKWHKRSCQRGSNLLHRPLPIQSRKRCRRSINSAAASNSRIPRNVYAIMIAILLDWRMKVPSNPPLFVDTSGWVRLLDQPNPLHQEAETAFRRALQVGQGLVTTNYIFAELVPVMSVRTRGSRERLLAQVHVARQFPTLQTIHVDEPHNLLAWAMLYQFKDKDWSLVDASSFVIMQELGITQALTSDHHF